MPLFSRSDGTLIKDLPPVRQIMPYLMKGRNESVVLHEARYDLTRTLPWLKARQASGQKITLFHLLLHAIARTLHERPGLNRFVSGGHVYQRRGVWMSFAAKKAFADDAPIVTVKAEFPQEDVFADVHGRIAGAVEGARRSDGKKSAVDKELALALMLPGPLLGLVMGFLRWLDRMNLMPGAMIKGDPMYASAFVANLGSIGISDVYHHLFEYGTVSLFAAVGKIEKMVFVDAETEQPVVRDAVKVCWTFDERIHDGFYCASSLKIAQNIVEDPEKYVR
jgi:2-oxoacid dehydrogenases acyltransferase (catalytic domain)